MRVLVEIFVWLVAMPMVAATLTLMVAAAMIASAIDWVLTRIAALRRKTQ